MKTKDMKCRNKKCNCGKFNYEPQTFKNGTKHYKRICKKCGTSNKWAPEAEVLSGKARTIEKEKVADKDLQALIKDYIHILRKIYKLGGKQMGADFLMELTEMYEYEKNTSI